MEDGDKCGNDVKERHDVHNAKRMDRAFNLPSLGSDIHGWLWKTFT